MPMMIIIIPSDDDVCVTAVCTMVIVYVSLCIVQSQSGGVYFSRYCFVYGNHR